METPEILSPVTLILGGARSGKSFYAENLITSAAMQGVYIATATGAGDSEMLKRIETHKSRRDPVRWRLVEEPLDLVGAITQMGGGSCPILIDCLSLWLANLLQENREPRLAWEQLGVALGDCGVSVVCVSEEVGLGMVPLYPVGREFRDRLGQLNQHIAAIAHSVIFMLSGLPLRLKPPISK